MNAQQIISQAAHHMQERAQAYDSPEGERTAARTVAAFNALTGHKLSEGDGWLFMVMLKAARATSGRNPTADTFEDLAAYAALWGECRMERNG